tara:strand:+ start:3123 stop:5270 length:2148 start_codon:yes stop_codon:yes gene_type:complete
MSEQRISIRQEPTQLNTVYTKLLYSITTSNYSYPQFKFVCDVEDYAGNLIQRIKQPANNFGNAVFNVAIPIKPQLQVDDTLYITRPTASYGNGDNSLINSYSQFICRFGEEYGTSPSSSVTVYDGLGNVGDPAVTGSILTLGRMTWEPWDSGFSNSSSAAPPYVRSDTGSFNFYVWEGDKPANYVDVNLRVNGVVPAGGTGTGSPSGSAGTGSFSWTGSEGLYDLEVYSPTGIPSADSRISLEIYDMSNQVMVYTSSMAGVLPAGYVSGSGGAGEVLITTSFTGSMGIVYGCRVNSIPTSSFNPPPFISYYLTSPFGSPISRIQSGNYPLFPGNVHNISSLPNNEAYLLNSFSTSGSIIGQALEVYPTLQDFNLNEVPITNPVGTGNFASWNFNTQDVRINWTGSNPSYTGDPITKTILTNWPQYQRESLPSERPLDNLALQNPGHFRTVSENDLGIVSWFNISGSIPIGATQKDAYDVKLFYFSPLSSSLETGDNNGGQSWDGAQLNGFSTGLVNSGSGADIPFCSGPLFPGNLPAVSTPSIQWNFLQLQINRSSINWWRREEPCAWQTRSNFAFINKWGVWDFIGLNTPTNKSARINSRKEFLSVNVDYNIDVSTYSPYNRGLEQYYLDQDYKYKIKTDPINNVNSSYYGDFAAENFYQELFISPNVMLQVDNTFVPINITNSKFEYKTNKKKQKTYQVEIEYEFSNKPRSRT